LTSVLEVCSETVKALSLLFWGKSLFTLCCFSLVGLQLVECKEEEILKGEVHNICNCFCIVIKHILG